MNMHHIPPLRILVVEDELRYLETTRQLLSHYGHQVSIALTGHQAAALLARQPVDLLLLDLHLPDMQGSVLLGHLQQHAGDAQLIVTSGDSAIDSAILALRHGACDFLRKPYDAEALLDALARAGQKLARQRENCQSSAHLQESERWHRFLVNSSPDVIYTLDAHGRFTFLNDGVESITGFSRDELLGQPWESLVLDPQDQGNRWHLNERRTGLRATHNHELRLRRRTETGRGFNDNPYVTAELSAMGIYQGGELNTRRFIGTYGVLRDISARKKTEAGLAYQAYHDALTGLPNRTLFQDRMLQAIANARRHNLLMAVMFMDLDRFKAVNDTLGHQAGDELLRMAGQRLRQCLREGDTLARISGDEFMLLLPHILSRSNAAHIAQKILKALAAPFFIEGHEILISGSIGIALFPDDGDTPDVLTKLSDVAMYTAKDRGPGGFRFFDSHLNRSLSGRLSVENEMRQGLERGEFELYYQPRVDIVSGEVVGMEALARWHHPQRGMVLPGEFLPIAEESGLISGIGEWAMRTACSQAGQWREQNLAPPTLAINLSPRQVDHPDFIHQFGQLLEEHCLNERRIEIEITEQTLMRDMQRTASRLKKLADMGLEITIDDFGAGASSLAYLKKLPIRGINIDRSLVRDIDPSLNGSGVIAGITALAKSMKFNVVAEGVETQEQLDYLRSVGCHSYQGYLFSHPVGVKEATRLLYSSSLRH